MVKFNFPHSQLLLCLLYMFDPTIERLVPKLTNGHSEIGTTILLWISKEVCTILSQSFNVCVILSLCHRVASVVCPQFTINASSPSILIRFQFCLV